MSPVVNEKTIHAEHGWWFPETEGAAPFLFGTFESNPNNCTKAFVTGQGGVGSPIKGMICKVYPVKEGDEMPYETVAKHGNFSWYEKVESPRADEIAKHRAYMEAGAEYDALNNIITTKDGVRLDLKTDEVYA